MVQFSAKLEFEETLFQNSLYVKKKVHIKIKEIYVVVLSSFFSVSFAFRVQLVWFFFGPSKMTSKNPKYGTNTI